MTIPPVAGSIDTAAPSSPAESLDAFVAAINTLLNSLDDPALVATWRAGQHLNDGLNLISALCGPTPLDEAVILGLMRALEGDHPPAVRRVAKVLSGLDRILLPVTSDAFDARMSHAMRSVGAIIAIEPRPLEERK